MRIANPRRRLGTGIALASVLALAIAGCKKNVYHGLTESEANEIIVMLSEYGISAEKVPGGENKKGALFHLAVDELQYVDAMDKLQTNNLPRVKKPGLQDTYASQSMIPTETEEHARNLMALQGELANTLEQVDGVVDVSVHLVLPEANPLDAARELTPARASVLIKYRGRIGEKKEMEKLDEENKAYRAMMISLGEDLKRMRILLNRDIADLGEKEIEAQKKLDTYFNPDRTGDQPYNDAKKAFMDWKTANQKRDAQISSLGALPKIKDLDKTLAKIADLEIEAMPFAAAQVKALIARSVKRLSEDDIAVEFTRVQPKPAKEKAASALPGWQKKEVFFVLSGLVAALAIGLIVLALLIMSLKKQLLQARQAAAKAASGAHGHSSAPSAPPAPG